MFKAIPGISKKILVISIAALFLVSMILFISPGKVYGAPAVVYVATTGNDTSGDGSLGAPFATIQKGINEVASGGTVNVAAGTYDELLNIIGKSNLTIKSTAGTASTIINARQKGGWVPAINIKGCTSITIDGFTIKDVILNASGGINSAVSGEPWLMAAILLYDSSNCVVQNNVLFNFWYGVFLCGELGYGYTSPCNGNVISNNELDGNNVGRIGIYIYDNALGMLDHNTVSGNIIKKSYYGVYINGDAPGTGGDNLQILNNTITGSPDLVNYFPGSVYKSSPDQLDDGVGICLGYSGKMVSIESNTISLCEKGVSVDAANFATTMVSYNSITGNKAYGICNNVATNLDATNNWWGNATGPTHSSNLGGTGDAVSDNVNFIPWLANPVGYVAPAPSKPLTPEEQASLDLSIEQQVAVYGASNVGLTKTLYDNILGRAADSGGLNDWVTALNEGSITLGDVVFGFVFSKELESKISPAGPEEFMTFLYKNVFDRNPDPDGFNNWVTLMQNGMTKEEVLLHFIDSGEFKSICEMFGLKP